jgi:hypothetical protein
LELELIFNAATWQSQHSPLKSILKSSTFQAAAGVLGEEPREDTVFARCFPVTPHGGPGTSAPPRDILLGWVRRGLVKSYSWSEGTACNMIPGPMRAFHPAAFAPPLPVLSSPLISPVHSLPRRYHAPSIQLHFSTTKHRARGGRCVALRDVSASGGAEQTAPTGKDADATGGLPAGALHPNLAERRVPGASWKIYLRGLRVFEGRNPSSVRVSRSVRATPEGSQHPLLTSFKGNPLNS